LAKSDGTNLGKTLADLFVLGQKLWYHHWKNTLRAICFVPIVMVPLSPKCCQSYLFLSKSCGTILDKTLSEPFDFGQKLWYHPWQYIVRAVCFGQKLWYHHRKNDVRAF